MSARSYGNDNATAARSTPGMRPMRSMLCVNSVLMLSAVRYRASCSDIVPVMTFVASTPERSCVRRLKVRSSKPAPTTSTMPSVTCETTRIRVGQRRDGPDTLPPPSTSMRRTSVRLA